MKKTINIGDELLKQVDEYTKKNGMTLTSLVTFALESYIGQRKAVDAMESLNVAMKRIAASGEVDEETKKQLDYFQFLVSGFNGK